MLTNGFVRQKTLKTSIRCRGIALHSGDRVAMVLHPAAADTGIVFRRSDRDGADATAPIGAASANPRSAPPSTMATACRSRPSSISWRRFAGLEIDNAIVELDGPEVPVMDGSAAPFVFLIECAGTLEQDAPRRAIKVLKPVRVGRRRQIGRSCCRARA